MSFQELVQRFSVPNLSATSDEVTPLIDGFDYFSAVEAEIEKLKAGTEAKRFFYLAGWIMHSGFQFPTSKDSLLNELWHLQRKGVDVRVFPWVSKESNFWGRWAGVLGVPYYNVPTLAFIKNMVEGGMKLDYAMNTLSNALGSAHGKFVVCGHATEATAFVGGMDFATDRIAKRGHVQSQWHDAGVRIRGPGALNVFHFFRQLWNEQLDREVLDAVYMPKRDAAQFEFDLVSHVKGTDGTPRIELDGRTAAPMGQAHVQILRTFPRYDEEAVDGVLDWYFAALTAERPQPGFASVGGGGLFEYREAVQRAIGTAEHYIYIEDQFMWGRDGMEYLRERIQQKPDLKVVLVYGRDPADGTSAFKLTVEGVNEVLSQGLSPAQRKQIAFWNTSKIVHSKIVIVDDVWAVVGSNNFSDRSFYTDIELAVSVLEDRDPPFAKRLRQILWTEHARTPVTSAGTWQNDIAMWSTDWGSSTASPQSPFRRLAVPFTFIDFAAIGSEGQILSPTITAHRPPPNNADTLPNSLVGRHLRIQGDPTTYAILSVDQNKITLDQGLRNAPGDVFAVGVFDKDGWPMDPPDLDDDDYKEYAARANFDSRGEE